MFVASFDILFCIVPNQNLPFRSEAPSLQRFSGRSFSISRIWGKKTSNFAGGGSSEKVNFGGKSVPAPPLRDPQGTGIATFSRVGISRHWTDLPLGTGNLHVVRPKRAPPPKVVFFRIKRFFQSNPLDIKNKQFRILGQSESQFHSKVLPFIKIT